MTQFRNISQLHFFLLASLSGFAMEQNLSDEEIQAYNETSQLKIVNTFDSQK